MGANLSLLAPHAHTVALRSYVDVLPGYKFLDVINDSRFLKTIRVYDTNSGCLLVVKLFIKPPQVGITLNKVAEALSQESRLLAQYPNVLPWKRIIETDSAGYLVRQLGRTNIYDRISLRPFLAPIEKSWIVFQLLKTVELLHTHLHTVHGDIKTENILVTSANWVVLTDFSQHTKPVLLPDDNPSEFVFYFDSSDRRSCYVAPERFYSKKSPSKESTALTDSMDLFSLGCVIAELYMDGEPTFTLSDLYRYKRNDFQPNLGAISDLNMRQMVKDLLSIDPNERPSASQLLEKYRGSCFPDYFYDYLYDFMYEMNSTENFTVPDDNVDNCSPSDLRIDRIYETFSKASRSFGYTFEKHKQSEFGPKFPALRLGLKGIPENYVIQSSSELRGTYPEDNGALIVLDLICTLLVSTKRPESRVKAIELILAYSERISDSEKLDRSLPYLCSLIDDFLDESSAQVEEPSIHNTNFATDSKYSTRVASTSLLAITSLLATCSSINAINALTFPEYLNPRFKNIAFLNCPNYDEATYIKSTLATCLPYLARISEKFAAFARAYDDDTGKQINGDNGELGSYEIPRSRTEIDFKDIAEALLIDRSVNLRICLVNHILPLCQYFGVDRTNDIVLPHLITYLNDSNYQLRLAFLSSIIDIGYFIGALAFEQYLLPLLFQTLGDHEQFVVLKVLEIFHFFVKERLINPAQEFNVLSVYKELLANSITLLLQPNEWIRQSVLYLILAISENLSYAERFCFLYPLIKSYLSYDISTLDWDTMYPCLSKPLSKQVYDTSITWLNNATNRSMFWKQTKFSAVSSNGKRKLISFTKDMGKSVYVPQANSSSTSDSKHSDIPLSPEDRQWILKLKAVGLEDKDLWKVFALKDHFLNLKRASAYASSNDQSEFELASKVNVPPKNIFFEVCYKSEPIANSSKVTESSYQPSETLSYSVYSAKESNSLVLPHQGKARASLQTVETNVLGEMEFNHESSNSRNKHHHIHSTNKKANMTHKVFSVNNQKLISATMKHNFNGSNPYILKYLQKIDFEPTINDVSEFGNVIKNYRESMPPGARELKIQGNLVAQINANSNANITEAFTKVAVCPTSEFFVTGSEYGNLKLWDTAKLDKNITGKNASAVVNLNSCITDIVFMPHRFVFAVSSMDGSIRIFRVHVTRGKNKKISKYSKIALIRSCKVEDGYPRSLSFVTTNSKTSCLTITSTCKIAAFDVITMNKEFSLQNPLYLGVPTTFIVSKSVSWLLLGTSDGILCLWDLRFHILVKAWRVIVDQVSKAKSAIRKLIVVSSPSKADQKGTSNTHFAMIGGSNESDITVWEIPSFECRQVFIANESTPRLKPYALQEVELNKEMSVEDILADLTVDQDQDTSRSNTALAYSAGAGGTNRENGYYITATQDSRVILWDLDNISKSVSLFTNGEVNFTKNQISSRFSVSYEKAVVGTKQKSNENIQGAVHDTITDLAIVSRPYNMVVAVERNGSIFVYK